MSLIVETGAGVAGANSYVSVETYRAFMLARGIIVSAEDADCEAFLLKSMDQLNSVNYSGSRVNDDQSLPYPRYGVYLSDNRYNEHTNIPNELAAAQMWLANYIENGSDPATLPSAGVLSEKIDVIEITYKDSQVFDRQSLRTMTNVWNNLKWLIDSRRSVGRH